MKQSEIINHCDQFLNISDFHDYCPNGLQVEGDDRKVLKVSLGVSVTLDVIEKAIENTSDLIIAHHGLIWNKDDRRIKGPFKNRLKLLLENGIAVASYHLPLDFHPEIGNNIQLALKIGLKNLEGFSPMGKYFQGIIGETDINDMEKLCLHIEKISGRPCWPIHSGKEIRRVAIMTGAAQGSLPQAAEAGADCFVTGEVSENCLALSREYGVSFISAGHYATEKFGIQTLGEHLRKEFGIDAEFIDTFNWI